MHPSRRCIYDEARACVALGKDSHDVIEKQVSKYKEDGYPKSLGLAETCILLRKHNEKSCVFLDELWASELLLNSCRDQLSFNYAIWRLHADVGYITSLQRMKQNEMFGINRHHE